MASPTILAALDTFQQAANRGTAVYLSLKLVQELRDALDTVSDADALAARLLLEQVAAMADCIGANTVGQITAISNRAAAWLRQNPPGQPVATEPRGCPTPGACSCVEPAPPAPEPGEVPSDKLMEQWKEECKRLSLESDYAIPASSFMAQRVVAWARQQQATELAALRGVPVAVGERLPEEGDCNAEGRCWCYTPPVDVEGMLIMNSRWILSRPDWLDTHWLPFNALPQPAPQAGEGEA